MTRNKSFLKEWTLRNHVTQILPVKSMINFLSGIANYTTLTTNIKKDCDQPYNINIKDQHGPVFGCGCSLPRWRVWNFPKDSLQAKGKISNWNQNGLRKLFRFYIQGLDLIFQLVQEWRIITFIGRNWLIWKY